MLIQTYPAGKARKRKLTVNEIPGTEFIYPATDHLKNRLNLHAHLVQNPAATFFYRVKGAMDEELGFYDGDLLVVDRSLAFKHHSIVVGLVEGELRICRLWNRGDKWALQLADRRLIDVDWENAWEDMMLGVVSYVIHSCI